MCFYDKMVILNKENKLRAQTYYKSYKDNPKTYKYRVEIQKDRYYLIHESDYTKQRVYSISDVYWFLNIFKNCYITNISLLRAKTNVFDKYLLREQDWYVIVDLIEKQESIINNFKIVKVPNIESYLARIFMVSNSNVLYRMAYDFFVIIKTLTDDILIVSELNLCVNEKTKFSFTAFYNVKNFYITNLNIADKSVGLITKLNNLFETCVETEEIYFENFDTQYVYDFSSMFKNCKNLKKVNLNILNTSCAITFNSMFSYCYALEYIDLSQLSVKKVKDFSFMFKDCQSLKEVNIDSWLYSDSSINLNFMFAFCKKLHKIKGIEKIQLLITKNCSPTIFIGCDNLTCIV